MQDKNFKIALGSKTLDSVYRTKNQNILEAVGQRSSMKKCFEKFRKIH